MNTLMKKLVFLLLLIIPAACLAQINITGKILNAKGNTAFPDATVFFSNTTIGTKSLTDGSFILPDLKAGRYILVVTAVGYEKYTIELTIEKSLHLDDIKLVEKPIELDNVVIQFDPNREKYLKMFKQEFLGYGDNTSESKILNPDVLHFKLDKKTNTLHVTANDFIEIENRWLGYKISYLLKVFTYAINYFNASYSGDYKFEKLKGTAREEENWEENRVKNYKGSTKHFLRALIAGNYREEGYDVYMVAKETNPQFADTNLIKRLIVNDTLRIKNDTNSYPQPLEPALAKYKPDRIRLIEPKLELGQMFSQTDKKGIYALRFDQLLKYVMFVVYNKKHVPMAGYEFVNKKILLSRPASMVVFNKPYALFDSNGVLTGIGSVSYSGYWGDLRVGNLLPLDYQPN